MDMPQYNANENRYFFVESGTPGVAIRLRGVSDLIHPRGSKAYGTELPEIRCNRSASRYPAKIMRLSAIFLAMAA